MKIKVGDGRTLFRAVFAGDVCPGEFGGGDPAAVMKPVAGFVRDADLRLVQWETPVAERNSPIVKSGPNLNSPEAAIETVAAAGFEVAMLANNHIGDQGPAAVLETIEKLHRRGLKTVGAGKDLQSARAPLVETVAGRTVAVFNFAENEFGGAQPGRPGSAPQDPLRDVAEVRAAAAEYDCVIVALHGGHEYDPFPSPRMVRYCRAFADAGARFVFNCHAHCPEGYEIRNGVPIVYCPGNFYFPSDAEETPLWWRGYLVRCAFGENGAVELELLPYGFDCEKVKPLDAADAARFEAYMRKLCAPLDDPAALRRYFEAWSAIHGKYYYKALSLALPPGTDWLAQIGDPGILARAMRVRNVFTCESHNDMLKCFFRLVEERRVKEAAESYAEIESLQQGF